MGGAAASLTRNLSGRPASDSFRRARPTISGDRSTPVTRWPAAASSRDSEPVPHPASSTSAGFGGSQAVSRPAHAARTRSARSPWSGPSSKTAAAASQYAAMAADSSSMACILAVPTGR